MAGRGEDERGGFFGGYTSVADMRDGGGAGRSGSRFEGGGVLSDIANMVATPRSARGSDTGQVRPVARPSMDTISAARSRVNAPYSFGRDLLDGGGLGRRATLEEINAGRGFRGGVPSMVANMVGIRPMGANDLGLVASYDAALASRPDISGQMGMSTNGGILGAMVDAQGAGGVGGVDTGLLNLGYPANASGMIYDDMRAEAAPSSATSQSPAAEAFNQQLQDAVGVDRAVEIMSGPYGAQAMREFTANGNQLPSQFSQRDLNIGIYGDPFGRGSMVGR